MPRRLSLALLLVSCAGGAEIAPPRPHAAPPGADKAPPPSVAPLLALLEKRPRDRVLVYTIARSYDAAGQGGEVVRWLQRLDDLGFDDALEPADFRHSRASPEFAAISARFAARAITRTPSRTAFTIDEPDLLAEGVAYDRKTRRVFVSSGAKRKVLSVSPEGEVKDLVAPETGGIYAVLGLEVDVERRALWAASAAAPFMANAKPEDAGKSALFQFDVDTGALRGRHELPGPPSLANDLAIARDGSVYVSDSMRGTVCKLAPGASRVEELAPADTFEGPNGVAIGPDGAAVFVADMFGLSRVDPKDGRVTRLEPHDSRIQLGGIDGLVSAPGGLIAIQNLIGRGRVWRIGIRDSGEIGEVTLLEANHPAHENPTTGEIGIDGFYYLANPHFQGRGTAPLEPAAGRKLVLLRLPLDPEPRAR